MKTKTKKLLFILILVVSIMAIIITASQIYDIIENQKVIDNEIDGIDGDENTYEQGEEDIFNETNFEYGVNWDPAPIIPYPPSFPKVYYSGWVVRDNTRTRVRINVQYGGVVKKISLNSHIKEETISSKFKYNLRLTNASDQGTLDYDTRTSTPNKINNVDNFLNSIFQNVPPDLSVVEYAREQFNITGIMYSYTYNTDVFNFTFYFINYIQIYAEQQTQTDGVWGTSTLTLLWEMSDTNIQLVISATSYNVESNAISYGNQPFYSIESNELLQVSTRINNKKLSQYNYEQITAEWGEGKELATIKCSIGEYYEYDESTQDHKGALAISTQNNDLPMIFNIGDLVIPYIAVANGQTEPLSIKLDGTPKVFKVTQIRPYFDGAFWQELTLQEHTK